MAYIEPPELPVAYNDSLGLGLARIDSRVDSRIGSRIESGIDSRAIERVLESTLNVDIANIEVRGEVIGVSTSINADSRGSKEEV